MSRIGKRPITVPNNVKVKIDGGRFFVEGPKGKLNMPLHERIKVECKGNEILVTRSSNVKTDRALHGMVRSSINSMILGVTDGFTKELAIEGVGFRAQLKGEQLSIALGFSHPAEIAIPNGIKVEVPKPNRIIVSGIDKALVGQISANIRSFYEPEPYKGKGIRYVDEYVRRKQGKTVG